MSLTIRNTVHMDNLVCDSCNNQIHLCFSFFDVNFLIGCHIAVSIYQSSEHLKQLLQYTLQTKTMMAMVGN